MQMSTVIKSVAGLTVATTVALIGVVKSIDLNRYRDALSAGIEATTGRHLTIGGPLKLTLGLSPTLTAGSITLAGPSQKDMLRIDRIEARIALLPLLTRRVVVRRLDLTAPEIYLERDAHGRGNWQTAPALTQSPAPHSDSPPTQLDLDEVLIRDARITWGTADGGSDTLTLSRAALQPNGPRDHLTLQSTGQFHGQPVEISGNTGALSASPWPLHLKAGLGGLTLVVNGTVTDPLAMTGYDLNLQSQGDDLAQALDLLGHTVPPLGPYKLSARLTDAAAMAGLSEIDLAFGRREDTLVAAKGEIKDLRNHRGIDLGVTVEADNIAPLWHGAPAIGPLKLATRITGGGAEWNAADVKARLGGSDFVGDLALIPGAHPRLSGHLSFGQLALSDLESGAPPTRPNGRPATEAAPTKHVPAPIAAHLLDLDLALTANRVTAGRLLLEDSAAHLRLVSGHLTLKSAAARWAGGTLIGEAAADAATASLTFDATHLDPVRLLREVVGSDLALVTGGTTHLHLNLHSGGTSLPAMIASLNGEATAALSDSHLSRTALAWAETGPPPPVDETTALTCAVARFTIRDGMATADNSLAIETPAVTMLGGGTVDLRSEAVALAVVPRHHGEAGAIRVGRLGGTLTAPTIAVEDGKSTIAVEDGKSSTAVEDGKSTSAVEDGKSASTDDHPCRIALGEAPPPKPVHTRKQKRQSKS
jgi:AsmA family protein